MLLPKEFIALDLETSGLDREHDSILEIALCKFVDGQPTETFQSLVQPQSTVRAFILELTHLDANELSKAPAFETIAEEVLQFIGELPLVAHNADMDSHFLNQSLEAIGKPKLENVFYDTLFTSRLAWYQVSNHRLETLVDWLQLESLEAHRALPDAIHCGHVFVKSCEAIAQFSQEVLESLAYLAHKTKYAGLFAHIEGRLPTLPDFKSTKPTQGTAETFESWEEFYRTGGPLAQGMESYQLRPDQIRMSEVIEKSLQKNQILTLEAGTGSGKTISYLSSLAKHIQGTNERIVIATSTKSLQDQIAKKELPLIQPCFPSLKPFVLKGRENYLCRRKVQDLFRNPEAHLNTGDFLHLMTLLPWMHETETGDISENSSFHSTRCQHIWKLINGDGKSCGHTTCEDFDCYAQRALKKASESNLLIINHSLFFRDLKLGFSLLPAYDRILFDEAHRLPESAGSQLGKATWFYKLRNILHLLNNAQSESTVLESLLSEELLSESDKAGYTELITLLKSLERHFHRFLMKIGKKCRKLNIEKPILSTSFAEQFGIYPSEIFQESEEILHRSRTFEATLQEQGLTVYAREFRFFINQLREFLDDFRHLIEAQEEQVIWLEEWANPHTLKIKSSPINPGKEFAKLYPWVKSAIFCSATLTYKGEFNYFLNRMGFDFKKNKRHFGLSIPSPWDLTKQQKVYIVDFLPAPSEKQFQVELDKALVQCLPGVNESTLCLFTAVHSLKNSFKNLKDHFRKPGQLLLAQHFDGSIENLTNLFRARPGSVLLGTQIFWEGVDLPGKELENLLITKLPFPNPSEPFVQAYSDEIKGEKGNPFRDFFVPETVLNLKQGIGRLLRTPTDTGKIILFDNRLLTQAYGKSFQRIWNFEHQVISSLEELKEVMNNG